jgi:hypothetical protein
MEQVMAAYKSKIFLADRDGTDLIALEEEGYATSRL